MNWPLRLYRVAGDSMLPTYKPGELLIGYRWGRPKPGEVVVVHHPRPIIKRLKSIHGRALWLEGDNAEVSIDSRQFGPVPISNLEAVIVYPVRSKLLH